MRIFCSLAVALIACGGDGTHHLADSAVDSPAIVHDTAPTSGPVTVVVTLDGAPAQGVQVYFQNADSMLVSGGSALTDVNGSATVTMVAGGFVTVLEPQSAVPAVRSLVRQPETFVIDGSQLDTFSDVKPGDVLHDDVGTPTAANTPSNIQLTVPTDTTAGVVAYELFATCGPDPGQSINITPGTGSGSGSGSAAAKQRGKQAKAQPAVSLVNAPVLVQLVNCTAGLTDMVVVSLDGSGAPVDFLYAPDVAVGTASGSGTPVTITGTYAAVPTIIETVTGLAASVSSVAAQVEVSTSRGELVQQDVSAAPGSAGSAALAVAMPTVPGGLAETEVTVSGGSGIFDSQIVLDWAASPAAAVSVDYQQTQIFDVTATPTFDVGTRSVTWSNGTIGNAPSVVDTMISVTRAAGSGSDSSTNWTWQLLGPATDEGSAALPVLPTDVFAWNPIDTDTIGVTELVTAIVPGGYDAVRGILLSSSSLSSIIDGAATGQIVVELADAGGPVAGVARGGAAPRASRTRLAKLWRAASSAARRPAR